MGHTLSRQPVAMLEDGRGVELVSLGSPAGVRARVLTLGAALHSLHAPDRAGRCADIVLGLASPLDYLVNQPYFGVTVGRYANRIAGARFVLDGRVHELAANDGPHTLHGGPVGLSHRLWDLEWVTSGSSAAVRLRCVSPAGEDGFPGRLSVDVTYELKGRELSIRHRARTDAPTVV